MKKSYELLGVISILFGTMIYGSSGVFTRHLSVEFSPFSQQYSRSFVIVVVLGCLLFFNKSLWRTINKKDIKWFAFLILSSMFDVVLIFVAFNHVSIASGYFAFYSSMIITGLVAGALLFSDKMTLEKIISIVLILVGIGFVFFPGFSFSTMFYLSLAILFGVSVGLWNVFSKKLSNNYSIIQMIFISFVFVFISALLFSLIFDNGFSFNFTLVSLLWLISFALLGLVAMALIVIGFKYLEAQKASLLMPVEIVFAALFGFWFYKETISVEMVIGGILIFIGALLPNVDIKKVRNLKERTTKLKK